MYGLRINARLDEQTAVDLRFLREVLGDKSVTDVLKYALQQVAQDLRDKDRARRQKQLWRESGLIGCIHNAPEDLSANYKQYVTEYLDGKYPQHASEK
ncbi:MAG TPA: hypothetical protein PLE99_05935 [Candidatus Thiothrix moscowensis]|uniref:hypothetical protein n=1 Tax=unclassified Thiothrix TaxID=2636184 RepID=UPI0025D72682|nr:MULTISPECIES: hypothetical protein [unclassified Thiothrix]HRJ52285.1 hypothetical protein [Candidatus Thiothrix moscowensis]HRJ92600.1 hypothetical protein [Candidatus Thiothrix moscowensis]